jgi:NADH:ubiquinone oxidoreductase subunit E
MNHAVIHHASTMKKHTVTICTGTACFVMGGSELLLLEDQLPDDLKEVTTIEGSPCIGTCKHSEYGKTQSDHAPFVQINGEVIEQANIQKIIDYIRKLNA